MANYSPDHIKNIALLGHAGSGKTTLSETMLFESGKINRRGTVEEGNTISDYHEIEKERGNSIFATLLNLDWRNYKINLIDTPGFDDFIGEVISALRVVDTGIMVLNSQYGVEVGTEIIWEYTQAYKKPMIFAVNQVDADQSDFDRTVEQARERFGNKVTVVQYPYNQGNNFNAIIDVLKMVMYEFPADGGKPEKKEIPEGEKAKASELHNQLVEAAAENDEALMELYFEKGSLDEDEMRQGIKIGMINHDIFPLFCLSAKRNMGSGRLMGFIDNVAPSAAEMPDEKFENGEAIPCDPDGESIAFVYKTLSEAHLGDMSFFKICSGELNSGQDIYNNNSSTSERLGQLFTINGRERKQVDNLSAGDLGSTVKLKNTHTNDTLANKGSGSITPIKFPNSKVRRAVVAVNQGDEEKISSALHHVQAEDPTVIVEYSKELKQTIIRGQGEQHLNIVKWKIENLFNTKVEFGKPRIPFRETIQKSAESAYKHKKQSGGAGQFAEVHLRIEPWSEGMADPDGLTVRKRETHELPWGGNLEMLWCIVGGSIDVKYLNAILKGIMEKMEDGPLTGSYVRDVRVSIFDGKMHSVDSNDMAFKIAATMAFKEAFANSSPKLMEPIHKLEVLVPEEVMGEVMSDLQTRRAIIQGMEAEGHYQKIIAKVPLMELYQYSSSLRSISQSRAKFNLEFAEYAPVPFEIQEKLIAENRESMAEA